jgi:hypothetical protein
LGKEREQCWAKKRKEKNGKPLDTALLHRIYTVFGSAWRSDFAKSYAGHVCGKAFFPKYTSSKGHCLVREGLRPSF